MIVFAGHQDKLLNCCYLIMDKDVPCYKCNNRNIGCHGKCKRYAAYHAERQKVLRQQQNQTAADHEVSNNWCFDKRYRRI